MSDAKAVRGGRKSDDAGKRTGPVTFLRQVIAELRKVVYPTQDQLVTYFFVVMVFVMVMIAIVTLLDLGFGKLVFQIFGGAGDS